ncbi:M13 family metallopeptidase [Rarobacter incanus]|uniref:Putative endopeptidase n=1 Tax=Rarobacter incanus TaxID=153494 RepID=A0A542SL64_9MICO|nr:M13-type metalloendopeptidase [Rarobacter incanus]TQK75380.1 putative endopeptidase [Rarobacter incanus]
MTESTSTPNQQRSGIATGQFDPRIRPQDDLYRHVNGPWIDAYEIPADRAADGPFRQLADRAEEQVRDIITGASSEDSNPNLRKVAALFGSFMDEAALESAGYEPLRADLEAISACTIKDEALVTLARLQRAGGPALAGFWVDTDRVNPDEYALYLMQAGLGLPDEAYYREEQHAQTLAAYRAHIEKVLTQAGAALGDVVPAAASAAAAIVDFETEVASHHWDAVRKRDAQATYNPMSLGDLVVSAPGFDWSAWAHAVGIPQTAFPRLIVREPSFFTGLGQVWEQAKLETIKAWAVFHVLRKYSPYLHGAAVDLNFDFYGRTLTGATEVRTRWKRGVSLVEGALGEVVGRLYVERHFPATHKARMDELVANLIEAYRRSITNLEWMGAETRQRALAKLDSFTPKIGYPAVWRDYAGLEFDAADLVGNVRASNLFDLDFELRKLGGPINRDEWFMTPQTVNAYYNPGMNEIVFPAAILQPPFFDIDADDAANYGGIGAVIGHEIGHGFDDQGSRYDGQGRLVDWWTENDRAEFESRTKALIAQYDAFVPRQLGPDGPHVNGGLTIGENIGDLGGLSIALRAYELALGGSLDSAPVIDGLSGAQRVFLSWAQVWRQKIRDEALVQRISVDPHSPNEFRCNGIVSNVDAFYEAFDVSPTDALYLDPAARVTIW